MLDLLTRWTEGESTGLETHKCRIVGAGDGNAAHDEGFLFELTGCCSSRDSRPPLYPSHHGMCFRDKKCCQPGGQTDSAWQHSKYSDVGTRRGLKTAAYQGAQGLYPYMCAYQERVYGGHTKAISSHASGRQMSTDAQPGSAEARLISTPKSTRIDVTTSCASAGSSSEQSGFVVDGRVALKPRSLVFDTATDHSARRFTCCSVEATVHERVLQERHGLPDDADEGFCTRSNSDSSHVEPEVQAGLCAAWLDPIATPDDSNSARSPMHRRSAAGSQMGASLDTLSRAPTGPSGRFESPNTLLKPNSIMTGFVATHTPTSPVQKYEPDEMEDAELPGKQWSETRKRELPAVSDDAIYTCGNRKSQLDAESGMKNDRFAAAEIDT